MDTFLRIQINSKLLSKSMEAALAPTRMRRAQSNQKARATWTEEEDQKLIRIASQSSTIAWSAIAKLFPNKTAPQIAGRWEKVLNPSLVKGSWTREEDEMIINYVKQHGDKDWAKLAELLPGRIGKQCRERWKNHLDPNVQKSGWTEEEDQKLIDMHKLYGNAWTRIASFFEGRTDNCVKNRWNSTIKRRLERMENGEPLVLKRGRKPKGYYDIPRPDLSETDAVGGTTPNSSPMHMTKNLIELVPITAHFMPVQNKVAASASVVENREHLKEMLKELA
ncbi:Myb-like DNA-binding domain containing protein [Tritrichomonas foetus]|uniref:Myb-like DNA-binding domain containing protein n=1 Tax=Tritrichomonas foetus TaxID=1144522 RepID=A0A1J4K226_9EUKA|nr:Myb-like DNA-binding domain containing protein [Tritrichomonas foetus]|eukprot:OHT04840.1 Myb-like DNA-binding domain containing protein [Tritrichomonas foetus]